MSLPKDNSSNESLQGSWVELHFSGTGSQNTSHHGSQEQIHDQVPLAFQEADVEKMLLDAQHESGRSSSRGSSQCNSPLRAQTPLLVWRGSEGNSSQSDEDFQERRREVENLMKKNADWIWDWSSRPENNPPKFWSRFLDIMKRAVKLNQRGRMSQKWKTIDFDPGFEETDQSKDGEGEAPEEQVPEEIFQSKAFIPMEFLLKYPKRSASLSIRNTSVMKKGGVLSADFLKLFLPSLIISHILAVGLGIYIGKRLTSHNTY